MRALGVLLTLFGLAATMPLPARAETPIYLTQSGSLGNSDGQFSQPTRVATDAPGNVYVNPSRGVRQTIYDEDPMLDDVSGQDGF